eukprot:6900230-Alexandrium_andersonii.AAC.1
MSSFRMLRALLRSRCMRLAIVLGLMGTTLCGDTEHICAECVATAAIVAVGGHALLVAVFTKRLHDAGVAPTNGI